MKVKDIMHRGVEWVEPQTPIAEIARKMHRHWGCRPAVLGLSYECRGKGSRSSMKVRRLARSHHSQEPFVANFRLSSRALLRCCRLSLKRVRWR